MREDIPPLLGAEYHPTPWRQGFVPLPDRLVLLVTLEKGNMAEGHRYEEQFLSPAEFQWQSQRSTKQSHKRGRVVQDHEALGLPVHLFVRRTGKRGGKATPFYYCGTVRFERWEGEQPITVWWRLDTPLREGLQQALGLRDSF